eukprot:289558-Rhodomonas_salina.1
MGGRVERQREERAERQEGRERQGARHTCARAPGTLSRNGRPPSACWLCDTRAPPPACRNRCSPQHHVKDCLCHECDPPASGPSDRKMTTLTKSPLITDCPTGQRQRPSFSRPHSCFNLTPDTQQHPADALSRAASSHLHPKCSAYTCPCTAGGKDPARQRCWQRQGHRR